MSTPAAAATAKLTRKVPIFNPVDPPFLKNGSKASIIAFDKAYKEYEKKLVEYGETLSLPFTPLSFKRCIEEELLSDICLFTLGKRVEQVTNDMIKAWIKETVDPTPILDPDQLDAMIKKELRMAGPPMDMASRVFCLFSDHRKLLKKINQEKLIDECPKFCVQQIVNALSPEPLKKMVKQDLALAHKKLAKDYLAFYAHVKELAITNERAWNLDPRYSGKTHEKPIADNSRSQVSKPSFSDASFKRTLKCWKCQGDHHLRNCPTTTEEEKDTLLKAGARGKSKVYFPSSSSDSKPFKPLPSTSSSSSSVSKPFSTRSIESRGSVKTFQPLVLKPGRILGRINETLDLPVLFDFGADENCIGEHHLKRISDLGRTVLVKTLESPIYLSMAFQDTRVQIKSAATITVTIATVAGRMRLRNVLTSVIEDETMDEFILGRHSMEEAGIDPLKHFHDIVVENPDVDCSHAKTCLGGRISSLMAKQLEDEEPQIEDNLVTIGQDSHDSISEAFSTMVAKATMAGLEAQYVPHMESLLEEFRDIWRLKLGPDAPVKVTPMKIVLKPDATPVMCRTRRYPPIHREYMANHVAELVQFGLVYPNRNASWSSPPLIVPKPNSKTDFRMTVDVRRVNEQTLPTAWPMPNLEVIFQHLENTSVYASFDLFKGYWQLPLDPESQELMSFMTDSGIYTPTRVIQGATGAVAFCQSVMQTILGDQLYSECMVWLDDILAFSSSTSSLLPILRRFFEKCRHFNLKLNAAKCCLFSLRVKWCGRIISAEGISQDPARVEALVSLAPPITGGDLQQFVCALNWMRTTLPNFAEVVSPLQKLLESVYGVCGKRTKKAVQKVPLKEVGWGTLHSECFQQCKSLLISSCTLAHPKADYALCVFTDASLDFWGSVVTQIPYSELDLPFHEQTHQALAFLSGAFKGAPSRWPIIEKEAFAIIETCIRLDYLLLRPKGFHLFTDHRNLHYLFNPFAHHPGLQRHSAARLQRWALILMSFEYTIEYIAGVENCWADLLSRWCPQDEMPSIKLLLAPVAPALKPELGLPNLKVFRDYQEKATSSSSEILIQDSQGILRTQSGLIWIPDEVTELHLRLCVAAHMGSSGHRGIFTTTSILKDRVFWTTMVEDVKTFLKSCLHCECTSSGFLIPRPLGEAVHGEIPNEVLHFDYLYMANAYEGFQYVLVLKEDFSSYCELVPLKSADSRTTADAVIDWCKRFGKPRVLVSDQGSHFKNNLVASITEVLGIHHHFTLAYVPWSNGTVERLNREILRMTRCLLSEFRLPVTDWPRVLPIVQMALNSSPLERFNGISPLKAFLGLEPSTSLDVLVEPPLPKTFSGTEILKLKNLKIQDTAAAMKDLHRRLAKSTKDGRKRARTNRKGEPVNFGLGDYVLVATQVHKQGSKLIARWRGPRKVIKVLSDWVFEIQDLLSRETTTQHAARLKFYADNSLNVDSEILYQIGHDGASFEVSRFIELRRSANSTDLEVLTAWIGLGPEEDSWEPLKIMFESVPKMVTSFLTKDVPLSLDARILLGI